MNNYDNITNLIQWLSFIILITDFNNTDLMKYLAHQDDLLDKIIEQNEEIKKNIDKILKNMSE